MIEEKEKIKNELKTQLAQFTGTEDYYQDLGVKFTDGIHYLAEEAKAYWLITLIGSYQHKLKDVPFQLWTLKVNEDNSAEIECREDTGMPILIKQIIPYTDFPLEEIKLYCIDGILLLPSEY